MVTTPKCVVGGGGGVGAIIWKREQEKLRKVVGGQERGHSPRGSVGGGERRPGEGIMRRWSTRARRVTHGPVRSCMVPNSGNGGKRSPSNLGNEKGRRQTSTTSSSDRGYTERQGGSVWRASFFPSGSELFAQGWPNVGDENRRVLPYPTLDTRDDTTPRPPEINILAAHGAVSPLISGKTKTTYGIIIWSTVFYSGHLTPSQLEIRLGDKITQKLV